MLVHIVEIIFYAGLAIWGLSYEPATRSARIVIGVTAAVLCVALLIASL